MKADLPFPLINDKTVSKPFRAEGKFACYSVFVIELTIRKLCIALMEKNI